MPQHPSPPHSSAHASGAPKVRGMSRRTLGSGDDGSRPGLHATRRAHGPRREVTERVVLRDESGELTGWTINLSRGGVRVLLEDSLQLGQLLEIRIGGKPALRRRGRVVWVQEECDGTIAGLEFVSSGMDRAASGSTVDR